MESLLKELFDVINWYYRSITKPTDKKKSIVAKMLKTIAYSFIVYLILTSPEKVKNKKLVTWISVTDVKRALALHRCG